ncbi:MAG: hypothetical protein U9N52_05800 [Campylobacterota bacterium]|nr:hypothetical protein [Campylobacterota bacterium]
MKKTLLLLITIFVASSFGAIDQQKLERKQDMQMLASGLKLLQDGLIYNNKTLMLTGVEMIEKGEKKLLSAHGDSLKKYLPGDTAYAYKYAEKAAQRISDYSKELSDAVKDKKDYTKISKTYSYIINECAGCHLRIRKQ